MPSRTWLSPNVEDVKSVSTGTQDVEEQIARPRVPPAHFNVGTHFDLRPLLERRHILMISISGTIGMGIAINSGEILKTAGSAGALLSYAVTGLIIHCVVSSLGEMVSLIPEAGALMEYPTRFVDGALGWTVAGAYWFALAMGVTTLTTSTAILTSTWNPDIGTGWIITLILAVVILINIFGIRVFGEIEYVSGFLKIILIVGLSILMLAINLGAGPKGRNHGIENWKEKYRFTDSYNGTNVDTTTPPITGSVGRFLSVWKGMSLATFSWIGVEIVAVTASEAKYPRDDLPRATRRIFWVTFCVYMSSVFFVSLVVREDEPALRSLGPVTGEISPFVIAIRNAGINVLPGFINAAFLFASWSTANTNMWCASRTLYGMAMKLEPIDHPYLTVFRQTTKNGVPLAAIFGSCIFAPLAYLQCGGQSPQKLLSVFSQVETVAILIVWFCQCLAFIRFYQGLQTGLAPHDRMSDDYPYCSWGQPYAAYFGCISCAAMIIFNGFDIFIFKPFIEADFLAAYLGLCVFVVVYIILKLVLRRPMVATSEMSYSVHREDFDRRRVKIHKGKVRGFLSWVFG